jgi:hypothetical protein
MLTDVPSPPDAGVKFVILGGGPEVTVKAVSLVAVPPAVVTAITPVVARCGTIAVICVAESSVKVALVVLNVTAVVPVRSVPAIVTDVPTGPLAGEKLAMLGAPGA